MVVTYNFVYTATILFIQLLPTMLRIMTLKMERKDFPLCTQEQKHDRN